jgi:hypothetical protein
LMKFRRVKFFDDSSVILLSSIAGSPLSALNTLAPDRDRCVLTRNDSPNHEIVQYTRNQRGAITPKASQTIAHTGFTLKMEFA